MCPSHQKTPLLQHGVDTRHLGLAEDFLICFMVLSFNVFMVLSFNVKDAFEAAHVEVVFLVWSTAYRSRFHLILYGGILFQLTVLKHISA